MTVEDVLNELAKEKDAVSWKCFVADKFGYPIYDWDELIEHAVKKAFLAGKKEKEFECISFGHWLVNFPKKPEKFKFVLIAKKYNDFIEYKKCLSEAKKE